MAGEARQIVLGAGGADDGAGIAQHDEIALQIERQLEAARGGRPVEHRLHAGQRPARRHQRLEVA